MTVHHLYGDDAGETHLQALEFEARDTHAGRVKGLSGIPATSVGFGEFVERKPDVGVHHAPRRQFLVVLSGTLEIVTTLDQRELLNPGDVLLADDVGSKGHISRDVGEAPLTIMAIGLDPAWELPAG